MKTIEMILEPDADGSLHVPLPPELRVGKVRIEARMEAVTPGGVKAGLWKNLPGKFWMAEDFDAPLEDFKDYM